MQSEKETNKYLRAETEKEVGKIVQACFFTDLLYNITVRKGAWEPPASSCGLFRQKSRRLQKEFCPKQNQVGEIMAHRKMIRYVQRNQSVSHYSGLALQRKMRLGRNIKQLFIIRDLFELA